MPSGVYKRSLKEIERTKEMGKRFGFQIGHKINLNRIPNKKTRDKMIKSRTGKKHTIEHRENQSKALMGRKAPWVIKMNKQRTCEKNPNWLGGKSFEPYTIDWTKTLKQSIRERDHYICQLCQKSQGDRAHSVHHIDYVKQNCNPNNLITLCVSCNTKVNKNREYWKEYFNEKICQQEIQMK